MVCYSDRDKVVEVLVECGVDINMKDESGKTALHAAIEAGEFAAKIEERKTIIKRKQLKHSLGNNVGSVRMVRCLINNSADVNAIDDRGYSPLMLALEKGEFHSSLLYKMSKWFNVASYFIQEMTKYLYC